MLSATSLWDPLVLQPTEAISISSSTGEKPQSKVWENDGTWWSVLPNNSGTWLWRLDGGTWDPVFQLSSDSSTQADVKVVGNLAHVLMFEGTSSELVTLEATPTGYDFWTLQPHVIDVQLGSNVEIATLDIDSTGRMWIASDTKNTIEVRYADGDYSSFSAPITVASGISSDDISSIIAMPGGKVGVFWSNQNSKRFGFRTHVDGTAANAWAADEVPASQSAKNVGAGFADDHMHLAATSDGTLYAAVKTSYDSGGQPTIMLLVRRPSGNWDNAYTVANLGTRPVVVISEAHNELAVIYTDATGGGDIVLRGSPLGNIQFGNVQTVLSGNFNDVTTSKANVGDQILAMATKSGAAFGTIIDLGDSGGSGGGSGTTNVAPTVNAGADQSITLPGTANLTGNATDDNLPSGTLTTTWTKVSGPGTVSFGNANALSTVATFSTAGTYVLALTANDGSLQSTDQVSIQVQPAVVQDTTPPTITGFTPTTGSSSAAVNTAVSVSFSEQLDATTVNSSTIFLRDSNGTVIPTSIAYNAATNTVTLTPTAALANSTTYTLVVKGGPSGVKDTSGNALAVDATSAFTTVAAQTFVTSSLWSGSTSPSVADSGDGSAVELGVKFSATTSGYITGLRFYKSAANTGAHKANLWSASGQLLATATFTSETGSGWQQVNFSSPVAITAGTSYIASYFAPSGRYSVNRSYFNSQYASGSLKVPVSGGVYRYGTGGFPSTAYQGSNYWVDVVLSTTPPVDNTAPTITAFAPNNGSAGAATGVAPTVTFSEDVNSASINSSTVYLRNASNVVVPTSVAYNSATRTVTLTPTATLANSTTYTIVVKGGASGVKDTAGNALAADAASSFTTAAVAAPVTASLWPTTTNPSIVDSGDNAAVELGVKFSATTSGYITGIRFYKSAANTGTHTASLWSATGQLLATGTFVNETASGWQTVLFSSPVAITAGTTYVASYHTNSGHYAVNRNYFASQYTSGPLRVAASGGVYGYGNGGFPASSYQASNYWVDPLFASSL